MTHPLIGKLRISQVMYILEDPAKHTLNTQGGDIVRGQVDHSMDTTLISGNDLPLDYESMSPEEVMEFLVCILEERLSDAETC